MWRKGEVSSFIDSRGHSNVKFNGTIKGISDSGLLVIEKEKGELIEFAFKELTYII